MSICDKAYAFDLPCFEAELLNRLERALSADDRETLFSFVDEQHLRCRDPYAGGPLTADWRDLLETGDIQVTS
jgi:hypothetical protein